MNVQETLYKKAERRLVVWCVVAMLIMSASFVAIAYFLSIDRLEQVAKQSQNTQVEERLAATGPASDANEGKQKLMNALLIGQGALVVIGAGFTVWFARKTLQPIRKAHKAQAEFAANAHHQLRTPIAVMQTEVEVALLGLKNAKTNEVKQTYDHLLEEIGTLKQVSEHLLTYAEANQASGVVTAVEFKEITELAARRYGVATTVEMSRDLVWPLNAESTSLLLDILFDNSVKHSAKALKNLRVTVTVEKVGKKVHFTYHDNGKGVKKSDETRIFTRGYSTSGHGHSGIGLSIVRDIVEANKGQLHATTSTEGFGLNLILPKSQKT